MKSTCHKCNRKGHFNTQCLSKTVAKAESTTSADQAYLFPLAVDHGGDENVWSTTVQIGSTDVSFKLDTGAEVTVIGEEAYRNLESPEMESPPEILYRPTSQSLKVMGQFAETLSSGKKISKQPVFVVHGLKTNQLGLPAITCLDLIRRMEATSISKGKEQILRRFPNVFNGLGSLGEPYCIQLRQGARTHSLFTARNVPIALVSKLRRK